jgi:deleted-in-malignant-brain-tumors protein 1
MLRCLALIFTARLQGPLSRTGTGRLEVFHNGRWGTICDDHWGMNDARVACRQLGYSDAVKALRAYEVPAGSGQIWLDNVACAGDEQILASCSHRGWGVHDCLHWEDAGVQCLSGGNIIFSKNGRVYRFLYSLVSL